MKVRKNDRERRAMEELSALEEQAAGVPDKYAPENDPALVDFNNLVLMNEQQAMDLGLVKNPPSKYFTHVQPRMELILSMRRDDGMTIAEVAKAIGVGVGSLENYAKTYPELRTVLMQGKIDAIAAVKNTLFKTANGYTITIPRQKIVKHKTKDGEYISEVVPYDDVVWQPPNVEAQKFFLQHADPSYNPKGIVNVEGELGIKVWFEQIGKKAMEERDKAREVPMPPLPSLPAPAENE